jgi:NAD(P)-dependent dehydrogenase (short-subunit alcohol dehydrogenase family)
MAARRTLVTGASRGVGMALAGHCRATGDEVVRMASGAPFTHGRYTHDACDVTDVTDAAVATIFTGQVVYLEGIS